MASASRQGRIWTQHAEGLLPCLRTGVLAGWVWMRIVTLKLASVVSSSTARVKEKRPRERCITLNQEPEHASGWHREMGSPMQKHLSQKGRSLTV